MVVTCNLCKRTFETQRGSNIHYISFKRKHYNYIKRVNVSLRDLNDINNINDAEITSHILEAGEVRVEYEEAEATQILPNLPDVEIQPSIRNSFDIIWSNLSYNEVSKIMDNLYNEIVKFRRNLFKLPTGKSGKNFIEEITFWLRQLNANTKLNGIAMKIFMILPSLLLQKPSSRSKAKEHSDCLQRRLGYGKVANLPN